jgi:DNA-binding MarR family transcriptional regulator
VSFDVKELDPVLESRMRVGILAILLNGDEVDFVRLRERLEATDGNLAKHLRRLEEAGYVEMRKGFIGRKPQTVYSITKAGKAALEKHVALLSKLIGGQA